MTCRNSVEIEFRNTNTFSEIQIGNIETQFLLVVFALPVRQPHEYDGVIKVLEHSK